MSDTDLYAQILGLSHPWFVAEVELNRSTPSRLGDGGSVLVRVALEPDATLRCPECGETSRGYDSRSRRWRHLDTFQFETHIEAAVPRVKCGTHGVRQVNVP